MTTVPERPLLSSDDIRRWIQDGFREYGPDPWLFLRELAQNSRDAGARRIEIRAYRNDSDREVIEFIDDGSGMSRQTARDYLFRFYASSKEKAPGASGRFGIGFWSVYRFKPERLRIFSRYGTDYWGTEIDAAFRVRELPPAEEMARGTWIVLQRPAAFANEDLFVDALTRAASAYCRHLMQRNPARKSLPVSVNGNRISRPLTPPGHFGHTFRGRGIIGGVALGENPEVRVFSGGLPVWRGTSIAELAGDGEQKAFQQLSSYGLYPVIWMEYPGIHVNLSRRRPINDARLSALRKRGEREIMRLFSRILDRGGRRGISGRIRDGFAAVRFQLRKYVWLKVALALMLLIPAEIVLLRHWLGSRGTPVLNRMTVKDIDYSATTIDDPAVSVVPDLAYSPENAIYFRLFSAEHFDARRGFVFRPGPGEACPPRSGAPGLVHVRLKTRGGPDSLLPHPPALHVMPSSLKWNSRPLRATLRRNSGACHVDLPGGAVGLLQYACFPAAGNIHMPLDRKIRLSAAVKFAQWPEDIRALFQRAADLPIPQRVAEIREFVAANLVSKTAPGTVARFRRLEADDWIRRVLQVRSGDCDVINGFTVLLLRQMKIPARLGVGWVGSNGKLVPRLHAWGEYFHGGWHTLDLAVSPAGVGAGLPQSPPADRGGKQRHRRYWWIALPLCLVLCTMAWLLLRKKRAAPDRRVEEALSRLVLGALLYPGRWGSQNRIWTSAVLPCLSGKRISLRQALTRIHGKGLFFASARNPMISSGRDILDSANPHYRRIFRLIHGAVDLDAIAAIRIRACSRADRDRDPLLDSLVSMGKEIRHPGWRVGITCGNETGPPRWIDISSLKRRVTRFWHRPVLVISLHHPAYVQAASGTVQNRHAIIFDLVRNSLAEAPVLRPQNLLVPSLLARRLLMRQ